MNFREYLINKKVALIGGFADYDLAANYYDVIVRTNCNWTLTDRVDVLYIEPDAGKLDATIALLNSDNVKDAWKIVNFATVAGQKLVKHLNDDPKLLTVLNATFRLTNPCSSEHEWLNAWRKRLDFHPLTGLVALKHLLRYDVEELFCTGMTFYYNFATKTFPTRQGPHDIEASKKAFLELVYCDSRVRPDNMLQLLLNLKPFYR